MIAPSCLVYMSADINLFIPGDYSTLILWTRSFQYKEYQVSFYCYHAASDLGLYCLPMSLLWDARYIWVNEKCVDHLAQPLITSRKHTPI